MIKDFKVILVSKGLSTGTHRALHITRMRCHPLGQSIRARWTFVGIDKLIRALLNAVSRDVVGSLIVIISTQTMDLEESRKIGNTESKANVSSLKMLSKEVCEIERRYDVFGVQGNVL